MSAQIHTTAIIARAQTLMCLVVEQSQKNQEKLELGKKMFWHLIQTRKSLKSNIDLAYLGQTQMLSKFLQRGSVTTYLSYSVLISFLLVESFPLIELQDFQELGLSRRPFHSSHYVWAGSAPHKYLQHLLSYRTSYFPNLNQYSITSVEGTQLI